MKILKMLLLLSAIIQINIFCTLTILDKIKNTETHAPKQFAQIIEKESCNLQCMNFYYEKPQLPQLAELKE